MKEDFEALLLAFQRWQIGGKLRAYRQFRELADQLADKYEVHLPDFEDEIEAQRAATVPPKP